MRTRLDLTGCIFGRLTVLRQTENIGDRTAWVCRCECGSECVVKTKDLRSGKRTTCGNHRPGLESLHYIDGTCVEMIRSKTVRSNNKSGVSGVFFDKKSGKWRAEITFQGKRRCLGRFAEFSKAVAARSAAEKQIYNEYILLHQQ